MRFMLTPMYKVGLSVLLMSVGLWMWMWMWDLSVLVSVIR